ncbi:YdeI/OmpD-associated family protein [Brevundimonas balnearis]|uniref:YdeI/OmpD-associated family protein n=1 Tax=Brevundimonas balnearis TaxID=1572858 RepID=A0ABV6R426_9CAUL
MDFYPHAFTGRIERHALGTMVYTVVFLPDDLAAELPFDEHPRLRMSGEINDAPVTGAWQPVRRRWYLMLNKTTLRAIDAGVGDEVEVRFRIEPQEAVDAPDDLLEAIARDPAAATTWSRMTAGQRRGSSHMLSSAQRAETRRSRILTVVAALAAGTPPGPPKRTRPR